MPDWSTVARIERGKEGFGHMSIDAWEDGGFDMPNCPDIMLRW